MSANASMDEPRARRYEPAELNEALGKRSAPRLMQIEAREKRADEVVVTGCRKDGITRVYCGGEAIRRGKGKR